VRSQGEARLGVIVDPRWFETWWARLLAIALLRRALWERSVCAWPRLRARKNEELARAYEDVRRIAGELEDTNRQLAVANVRLRALSYSDGLTGVANRRRFDEAARRGVQHGESGEPVSLVLIDLDHFKRLNDSQGHQDGDEALRAVASLLAASNRRDGGLARVSAAKNSPGSFPHYARSGQSRSGRVSQVGPRRGHSSQRHRRRHRHRQPRRLRERRNDFRLRPCPSSPRRRRGSIARKQAGAIASSRTGSRCAGDGIAA